MRYKRSRTNGVTYFFTVVTYKRKKILCKIENAALIKEAFKYVGIRHPFREHQIRDDRDLKAHVDYIHYNPVKHGLVKKPADWEWSSFHRYVKERIYGIDWGTTEEIRFEDGVGYE